jgi:hypothetical protein
LPWEMLIHSLAYVMVVIVIDRFDKSNLIIIGYCFFFLIECFW